jgi:hypothetical protein
MAMRPKLNAQPNKSLIDGIATLQALATSPDPVGSRELARRLNIDSVKVNRLLKTLAYLGIARQTADRKYTAGPGMHVLAAQSLFASGLIRNALPVLEGLRRFGHTVALGVLWQDNVSYLFHAPPGIEASRGLGRIGLLPLASCCCPSTTTTKCASCTRIARSRCFLKASISCWASSLKCADWVMRACTLRTLAIITSSRCLPAILLTRASRCQVGFPKRRRHRWSTLCAQRLTKSADRNASTCGGDQRS